MPNRLKVSTMLAVMVLGCSGLLLRPSYHGRRRRSLAGACLLLVAAAAPAAAFDLQGHRGARGLAPENTLAAVSAALAVGVDTLELDLLVSADDALVVLHDPLLDPALVRDVDGRWLGAPGPAVRSLTLGQLRAYDVGRARPGSTVAERFPGQRPADGERIPTLAEVVQRVRELGADRVRFNLETKIDPARPELAPPPERFADLLVAELRRLEITGRSMVQSFDWRTLRRVQALAPEIPTACLTVGQGWQDNLAKGRPGPSPWTAGLDRDAFETTPALVAAAGCRVWSPFAGDLEALSLHEAQGLGLLVVPWTVNGWEQLAALLKGGVDGIITDHPERLRRVMAERGLPLPPAFPPLPE